MSLFNTPGTGTSFFRPSPGQYVGKFKYTEEGPPSQYQDAEGNPKKQVRWVWSLRNMDGSPVLDPDGEPADGDGLTSLATGPASKAAEWFKAHGHELEPGEDMDEAEAEIVDVEVMLMYADTGDKDSNGRSLGRLKMVMPYAG